MHEHMSMHIPQLCCFFFFHLYILNIILNAVLNSRVFLSKLHESN